MQDQNKKTYMDPICMISDLLKALFFVDLTD